MSSKESGKVRYAYGVAMALLLGGTAFSIASGPVDVVGIGAGDAERQLRAEGLAPVRREQEVSDPAQDGQVIDQRPALRARAARTRPPRTADPGAAG
mgnify:CR=1 FL=1